MGQSIFRELKVALSKIPRGLRAFGLAALAAASLSLPCDAHHSIVMYDRSVEISLLGTVTAWEWTNPHCWLHIRVEDESGTPRVWTLEGNSTGQMARGGWSADSVKVGDVVTVIFNPIRDGTRAGRLGSVHFSDGRVLHRGGDASGSGPSPF